VVTTDAELAARFAGGDPDVVRVLYQRFGGLVYSVAYKVLGDIALAEDATQQTFVQAWKAARSFDPARALGPWLATIAQRSAIDVYRYERRHRGHQEIDVSDPALAMAAPSADQLSDVWEVRQAVDSLPEQDRELIRLQHFGELTHTEIAAKLEIPIGTVKSRSHRAHRRLAGLLGHLRSAQVTAGAASGDGPSSRAASGASGEGVR
jgi:RNA polymerase sigma factor (sigma-70 family)